MESEDQRQTFILSVGITSLAAVLTVMNSFLRYKLVLLLSNNSTRTDY